MVGYLEDRSGRPFVGASGNFLTENEGKILFVFTSAIMFGLRFSADFIERRLGLSPVGLLFVCSVLAFGGCALALQVGDLDMAAPPSGLSKLMKRLRGSSRNFDWIW